MGFKSYHEIAREAGGTVKGNSRDVVKLFRITDKKGKVTLQFNVGKNVMEKAGLQPGDKLDVLVDQKGKVGLLKKSETGWSLSKLWNDRYSSFGFRWREGMITVEKTTELETEIAEDGIRFKLPAAKAK
jgi:hypothetical protein